MTTGQVKNPESVNCLLVDDDVEFSKSLQVFLDDLGFQSKIISDTKLLYELLENEKPSIIFLDLQMPDINGTEIIFEVRKRIDYLPIIVISGTSNFQEAVEAVKLGADDFISKPITNFEQLEISINRALQKAELLNEVEDYKKNLEMMVQFRTTQLLEQKKELQATNSKLELEIEKRKQAEALIKQGTLNIIDALEAERKRLARELHDSVQQKLVFAKINLELFQKQFEEKQNKIESSIQNLDDIASEISGLVKRLYPVSIDKYSLTKNLETLLSDFESASGINLYLQLSGEEKELPRGTKISVYRVFQEALNNIIKHSKATFTKVLIRFGDNLLSAEIENDMPLNLTHLHTEKGIGLFTMKERIENLGGKFVVSLTQDHTVRIEFKVPI